MYKRRANELINALRVHLPDAEFVTNELKPRSKSFEVTLELHDKQFLIWTGRLLSPRAAKFPEPELILKEMNKLFDLEDFSAWILVALNSSSTSVTGHRKESLLNVCRWQTKKRSFRNWIMTMLE